MVNWMSPIPIYNMDMHMTPEERFTKLENFLSAVAEHHVVDHLKLNIFEPAPVDHEVVEDVG